MISSLLGLETSERLDLKKLDGGEEFLLSLLILVFGSADSNSDKVWHVSAASGPEESVKLSVNSDILKKVKVRNYTKSCTPKTGCLNTYSSVEFLGSESSDVSNSGGGSLLESDSLESLMHVKGEISGSVLELLLSSVFGTCHLQIN